MQNNSFAGTVTGVLLIFGVVVVLLALVAYAWPQGEDHKLTERQKFFQGLMNKKTGTRCCNNFNGHPPEAVWDIDGNHYKVMIEGQWVDVPDDALIDKPNLYGGAVVWYWTSTDVKGEKTFHIRCFLPGTMS